MSGFDGVLLQGRSRAIPGRQGAGRLPPKRATAERTESRDLKQTIAGARWVVLAVAALTALGLALRLARYQQSVFGDEMSTLYIVEGRSLSEVMSYVSGDAEISPPLFFILAWLTTKLGSAPELVRLPSLIAGTMSIPLVYLVGARAVSRPAGLIAAGVMALTPFMIFYSADGRGYAVTIALLLASTLAMLEGARSERGRWWVAYGAFSVAGDVHALHRRVSTGGPVPLAALGAPASAPAGVDRERRGSRPLPALAPGPRRRLRFADDRHPLRDPGLGPRREAALDRELDDRIPVHDAVRFPRTRSRLARRRRVRRRRQRPGCTGTSAPGHPLDPSDRVRPWSRPAWRSC